MIHYLPGHSVLKPPRECLRCKQEDKNYIYLFIASNIFRHVSGYPEEKHVNLTVEVTEGFYTHTHKHTHTDVRLCVRICVVCVYVCIYIYIYIYIQGYS